MNKELEKFNLHLELESIKRFVGLREASTLTTIENYINNLQQELAEWKENYKGILKQRDDISKNASETIEKYQNENEKLIANWNELKDYFKKQTIDLELKREDMSAEHYVDRKMFLKEVLSKMQEILDKKDKKKDN